MTRGELLPVLLPMTVLWMARDRALRGRGPAWSGHAPDRRSISSLPGQEKVWTSPQLSSHRGPAWRMIRKTRHCSAEPDGRSDMCIKLEWPSHGNAFELWHQHTYKLGPEHDHAVLFSGRAIEMTHNHRTDTRGLEETPKGKQRSTGMKTSLRIISW